MKKVFGMLFVALAFVLVGCSPSGTQSSEAELPSIEGTAIADSGTLLLKVNPEIAIDYDQNGKVTSIRGINDDGEEIIANYPDFIGKNSEQVLQDLIVKIGEAGYFVEEVEGKSRQIVIELEEGSVLPDDKFLEKLALNAQKAVEEYQLNSDVTVEGDTYISLDEAKQIAFDHAGVDGTNAKFDDQEFDMDDGVPSYELEFKINGNEYEYDIHALTGEVLKFEADLKEAAQPAKPAAPAQPATPAEPAKPAAPAKPAEPAQPAAPVQPAAPEKPAAPVQSAEKQNKKPAENKQTLISLSEAKQIAFNHAGIDGTNAVFDDQELDSDDGVPVYELEFDLNGIEYEYDIHAVTGDILEYEHDHD